MSAEKKGWVTLPLNLGKDRAYSTSWTDSQDGGVIMGGFKNEAAGKTSETVSTDGVSIKPSFNMKYETRYH